MLWLDIRDQFSDEHLDEWETQKYRTTGLNDLKRETEVVHRDQVISRQHAKECADSKEATAKELPLNRRTARAERQACVTPTKVDVDVSSTNAGVPLYPNWVVRSKTKPTGQDAPMRYQAPRDGAVHALTLSEELDEASVLDPLQSSQPSQPDAANSSGTEGPKTPPHYSEASPTVPPFDLAQLGILPKMSLVTEQENDLLNMAPGSPVRRAHQDLARVTTGRSVARTPGAPCPSDPPLERRASYVPFKCVPAWLPPQYLAAGESRPPQMQSRRWTPPTRKMTQMRINEVQDTAYLGQCTLFGAPPKSYTPDSSLQFQV